MITLKRKHIQLLRALVTDELALHQSVPASHFLTVAEIEEEKLLQDIYDILQILQALNGGITIDIEGE